MQAISKYVTVNGLSLHYLEWGGADTLPVLCVHGYTSSAEAFNAPARHLADRCHIIALDVRGHGESAWSPDGAYQYGDQVSDLAALADRLELTRFVLIGTSMGGIIAMAYAAAHKERLIGLVINDIGPDVERGSERVTQMVVSRPEEFATLEDAMAYRRAMSPVVAGRSAEDQRELALGVLRQRADGRWGWKMDPAYVRQRVRHGRSAAAGVVAGASGTVVPDLGGMGNGERCPLRGTGPANGRSATAWRAGRSPRCRARADASRAGGARRPQASDFSLKNSVAIRARASPSRRAGRCRTM